MGDVAVNRDDTVSDDHGRAIVDTGAALWREVCLYG